MCRWWPTVSPFPNKTKKKEREYRADSSLLVDGISFFWLSRAPCAWIPVARHRHSYFLGSSSLLRTSYIVSVRHSNFCLPPQKKVVFQVASSCSNFAHGSLSCTYDLAFAIVAQQHARTKHLANHIDQKKIIDESHLYYYLSSSVPHSAPPPSCRNPFHRKSLSLHRPRRPTTVSGVSSSFEVSIIL